MDPNANLKEQREIAAKIIADDDRGPIGALKSKIDPDDAARLAELVQAMDEWLCKGGFKPKGWG